jgi:hypothetical protein
MKKLAFVFGVVLATAFNTFSQKIDIHVTQVLVQAVEANLLVTEYSKDVDSYYVINLETNTLIYKTPGNDIVYQNITSYTVSNKVITIVYEDDDIVDPSTQFNPMFIIDKHNNSVKWINQESQVTFTYNFVKFSMKIIKKS